MLGFDLNNMSMESLLPLLEQLGLEKHIPALEQRIIKEHDSLVQWAGVPLMAIIKVAEDKSHIIISLYKHNGNGELSLWNSFHFSDILKLFKKDKTEIINGSYTSSPRPITPGADAGATAAGNWALTGKELPETQPGAADFPAPCTSNGIEPYEPGS